MSICSNKHTASRTRLFLCVKHGINAVNVSFAVHMWAIYRTVSSALSLIMFFESPSFSAIIGRIILKYNRKFDGSSISDKHVPSVLIALSHTLKLLSFNGTVNVSRIYPRSSLYESQLTVNKRFTILLCLMYASSSDRARNLSFTSVIVSFTYIEPTSRCKCIHYAL
jgi:hypothetical protein